MPMNIESYATEWIQTLESEMNSGDTKGVVVLQM